ncbi:MAG TPA: integrase, partial [Micromonospora sp.]
FAIDYAAMKWPDASAGHRRSIAESLTTATTALISGRRGRPADAELRAALTVAFSRNLDADDRTARVLDWLARNTRPVADLAQPDVVRAVLAALGTKLDGGRAAPDTLRRKRMTLTNALAYAVERELLTGNPLADLRVAQKARGVREVDRRSVVNPVQARTLLNAVRTIRHDGPRLVAFFGLLYHAALRPEEAAALGREHLAIPADGWGELHLTAAVPDVGGEWTDSGRRGERRGLKHRGAGEGRIVPCTPELTALLHEHLRCFGTGPDGRLFRGSRNGGRVSSTLYGRIWAKARAATFTPEVAASPLARRPYDLRHAAVSTWLNAGIEAPRVAEWAGHSVAVLLRTYAKCLDGGERQARERLARALAG